MTIKEIAKLCNTSRGTVDRVLNNRGNVNEELRQRILTIIDENHYKPNSSAKALSNSQKKFIIGVIINSVGNLFFDKVLEGINVAKSEIANFGIQVEIRQIKGYSADEQLNEICQLEKMGINALILTPIQDEKIVQKINKLSDIGIKTALINSDLEDSKRIFVSSSDNIRSGEIASNIALIALRESQKTAVVIGSCKNAGHIARLEGFRSGLGENNNSNEVIEVVENNDDELLSYKVVKKLIENQELSLIYFASGGVRGGLEAIEESGRNIKAITMDESDEVKKYIDKGIILATITQEPYLQGYKPLKVMADYLLIGEMPKDIVVHTNNYIKVKKSIW